MICGMTREKARGEQPFFFCEVVPISQTSAIAARGTAEQVQIQSGRWATGVVPYGGGR